MTELPILVLLFSLMACGVLVALVVRRRPPAVPGDIPSAIARRAAVLRWAGVTLGLIVGIIATRSGGLGTGLLMAAPLFGLCALLGVLAGELTVRPPHGPTRTAIVEVRRIRDYLPRRLSRAVAAAGGVLLVLLAATTSAGAPDDMGRPGRSLTRQCASGTVESHGPWPGLFYAGRLAPIMLAGLLLAYLAARTIVGRPRSGSAGDVAADDALRRRAARAVTGAVGVLIAIPLGGISLTAAGGLLGISCAPTWWTFTGLGLLVLVPASLAMISWCAAAVLSPMDRADPLVRAR
jgi:hypothetical protein